MTGPKDLVVIEDGAVRVAGGDAERRLRDRAGRYHLLVDLPGFVVFRKEEDTSNIPMAGQVIGRMSMIEIVNIIAQAGWQGLLEVFGEGHHRALMFEHGALRFARSDAPEDLLGEVLFRRGLLSRAQLNELLPELGPERRIGAVAVDRNIIDRNQLFDALKRQTQDIFFSTLLVTDGHYLFRTLGENDSPPPTTLHLPIQGLLMEGVQRIDEMALFEKKIPSNQLCPIINPGVKHSTLNETAYAILEYSNGVHTIEEIARLTGLGEFETTRAIYHLMQQKVLGLQAATQIDEEAVRALVEKFNAVMQDIFVAVATYGGLDNAKSSLDQWIEASGYRTFFTLGALGEVEPEGVLTGLETAVMGGTNPLDLLHQALHELTAFALFSATATLPRDQELALARDVNRRLKRISQE